MSRCELRVRIDDPARAYVPGDEVKGTVEVAVDAEYRCGGLTVSRLWKTHGRGNVDEGGAERVVVFTGTWTPGQVYTYSFSFVVPDGPFTYHGREINVDWYVQAQADIPWSVDPTAQQDFLVRPDPARPPAPPVDSSESIGRDGPMGKSVLAVGGFVLGCLSLFLVPFVLVGVGSIAYGVYALATGHGPFGAGPVEPGQALIVMVFGVPWFGTLLIPAALGALLAPQFLLQRAAGPLLLVAFPRGLRPGQSVRWRAELTPRRPLTIEGITVSLVGTEVAESGSGTQRTTHTHELHSESTSCMGPGAWRPGAPLRFDGTFTLPKDAAPSFEASDNRVVWAVRLRVRKSPRIAMEAEAKLDVSAQAPG